MTADMSLIDAFLDFSANKPSYSELEHKIEELTSLYTFMQQKMVENDA